MNTNSVSECAGDGGQLRESVWSAINTAAPFFRHPRLDWMRPSFLLASSSPLYSVLPRTVECCLGLSPENYLMFVTGLVHLRNKASTHLTQQRAFYVSSHALPTLQTVSPTHSPPPAISLFPPVVGIEPKTLHMLSK